ncbi:MAG: glycosyltransferase family 2 protein [Patescibacteria group bacterium]
MNKITVVIPAHNEEKEIGRCIESVLKNNYENKEIIVVNDGSTDKTAEVVKGYQKENKNIKLLNFEEGHSAAFSRNRGAEKATGEVIIFCDADDHLNDKFLEEIGKKIGKVDGFIVICLPVRSSFMNKALAGMIGRPFKLKLQDGSVYDKTNHEQAGSMFFTITKKAFQKMGGYDEKTFYFEDHSFSDKFYDMGFKAILVKNAVQFFELPNTFHGFIRQCQWIGKGTNTIKNKKMRRMKKLIWLLKFLFIISPLFFVWNLTWFLIFLIGTIAITYIRTTWRNKKPLLSFVTLPLVYLKTILVFWNILFPEK